MAARLPDLIAALLGRENLIPVRAWALAEVAYARAGNGAERACAIFRAAEQVG